MKRKVILVGSSLMFATVVLAHDGVQNPAVKARMDSMGAIAENMKSLSLMLKGNETFDLENARLAVANIADHAGQTPALFEAQENDPKSEAKDEIWTNFDDFSAQASNLQTLALQLVDTISTKDDLGPAMRDLGASCKDCHSIYRE